ncbi:GcrA family cell cycle regulator [Devosia neptuniae]|jgi:GcrA cell cycle regulator|uniref:GcrA family cell cycle regulator n=2 Tax=Devosia TaxID=46913 RepID=UPI0022AFE9B6|nr:GcrA family cell cycle regulator [Devosia neptuniae]MCZ4346989.1 GcrA cell cycle regulator [Devosia neptuniae]|tara:strand:+ start:7494 stop:8084 length:591 start_codon:yes stop_codon:yes gene_type:complete
MKDSVLTMVSGAQPAGWTDERVETLKKLWMEGLSASQIAGQLGEGVTRNAVIGKVHRLKLSARAKPTNSTPRARPAARPAPRRVASPSAGMSSHMGSAAAKPRPAMSRPQSVGATALAHDPQMDQELYVAPAVQELFIPEDKRLSLLQLSEDTCKWPIGDPLGKDFYFCGQHSLESGPYCEFHSKRAYHQVDKKRR